MVAKRSVNRAEEEGYEVVFNGNWPPGNPYANVHVARGHFRTIEPSPSPTTPASSLPPSGAPSSCASVAATAPRPTTAGKSVRLIRSLLPEMDLPGCQGY
uniref:Uncharacterized protein n=1 Tax=Setaria viridis TaxID=4556 RepID=A0A4U6U1Q8_SETVI|nr:hypothetical protein SEVIR_6G092800v2 [Setaria viridis]